MSKSKTQAMTLVTRNLCKKLLCLMENNRNSDINIVFHFVTNTCCLSIREHLPTAKATVPSKKQDAGGKEVVGGGKVKLRSTW